MNEVLKLDGIGFVDNRPTIDFLHNLVIKNYMSHMTRDTQGAVKIVSKGQVWVY